MEFNKERPVMYQCSECKLVWIMQLKSTEEIGRHQKYKCPYCEKGESRFVWTFK